jgi:hypothetical protein
MRIQSLCPPVGIEHRPPRGARSLVSGIRMDRVLARHDSVRGRNDHRSLRLLRTVVRPSPGHHSDAGRRRGGHDRHGFDARRAVAVLALAARRHSGRRSGCSGTRFERSCARHIDGDNRRAGKSTGLNGRACGLDCRDDRFHSAPYRGDHSGWPDLVPHIPANIPSTGTQCRAVKGTGPHAHLDTESHFL